MPKLRHTAALALAGWYLMVPPVVFKHGKRVVATEASLAKWTILQDFASRSQCEAAGRNLRESVKVRFSEAVTADRQLARLAKTSSDIARCIAIDDLRLKEK